MKYWLETFISHFKKMKRFLKKCQRPFRKHTNFPFIPAQFFNLEYVLTLASLFMFIYYFVHDPRITHFGARI